MKYTITFCKTLFHEFWYGTRFIWKEHHNECVIFLLIACIHLLLSLFASQQEEARSAYSLALSSVMFMLTMIVFFTGKRNAMFSFWFIVWYGFVFYTSKHPFYIF